MEENKTNPINLNKIRSMKKSRKSNRNNNINKSKGGANITNTS